MLDHWYNQHFLLLRQATTVIREGMVRISFLILLGSLLLTALDILVLLVSLSLRLPTIRQRGRIKRLLRTISTCVRVRPSSLAVRHISMNVQILTFLRRWLTGRFSRTSPNHTDTSDGDTDTD